MGVLVFMKKFSLNSLSLFFTGTLARMADCFTILSICCVVQVVS